MIVANSTPLIHLSRIGRLELLSDLYDTVIITEGVHREVVVRGLELGKPEAPRISTAVGDWIEVAHLEGAEVGMAADIAAVGWIGGPEAESIMLAEGRTMPLIMDDLAARRVAAARGVALKWTLTVVLEAVATEVLRPAEGMNVVRELVRSGLHVRPTIIITILDALGEA